MAMRPDGEAAMILPDADPVCSPWPPSAPVRAVIFDFDGVILESTDIKTEAFLGLFAEYPEHQPAILRHHLQHQGISRYSKFEWIYQQLLDKPLPPEERDRLGAAFSELVLRKILVCEFVPGAIELLRALRGRVLSFVASGTPQEELEIVVRSRNLSSYFDGIWGTPAKKPEIIAGILDRYSLASAEVIFVGDGISDYDAAHICGIPFIARDTPAVADDWCELGVARVHDLHELSSVLGLDA